MDGLNDALARRQEASVVSEALVAFASAQYARCIEICDASYDIEHAILAASAAFRRRDYEGALRRAEEAVSSCPVVHQRIRALGTAASAYGALGRHEAAQQALAHIDVLDLAGVPHDVVLQARYAGALVAWMAGDYRRCDTILRGCDYARQPHAKANGDFLRSWVLAKQQRFAEQAALLCEAIKTLQEEPMRDVGTLGRAVHALSVIVREMHVPRAAPLTTMLVKSLAWTDDLTYEHFHALRNIGWHHALQANYIAGIRNLDLAKRLARDEYELLMSHLDHAQIARLAGEPFTQQAQLMQAAEIMDGASGDPSGDESLSLVVAAEVFVDADPRRSRSAIERFRSLRDRMGASFALAGDPRTEGMYRYALAVLAERDGRRKHACDHAQAAFDIFEPMGFAWRAARAALLVYRCGGEARHARVAKELISPYPRSFVSQEISAATQVDARRGSLTSRQRQVLDLLLEGLTVGETARRLNASPNTIKVHKRRIYAALGVRTRMDLAKHAAANAVTVKRED